jgi:hypothetical protein
MIKAAMSTFIPALFIVAVFKKRKPIGSDAQEN